MLVGKVDIEEGKKWRDIRKWDRPALLHLEKCNIQGDPKLFGYKFLSIWVYQYLLYLMIFNSLDFLLKYRA